MKQALLFVAVMCLIGAASGQDTTATSFTDSARMYTYKNVYIAINQINVTPPGTNRAVGSRADSAKWITVINISVFTSKADFKVGRSEITRYSQLLYTDKMPTWAEIQARLKQSVK